MRHTVVLAAAVALASRAQGARIPSVRGRATTAVEWGPCNETELPSELPIQCGVLPVPLDYTQPNSSEKLPLELVRFEAVTKPSKGIIQFNFGGPGSPGRSGLVGQLATLAAQTGGEYDLISYDPRGVGKTIPFICDPTLEYGSQLPGESDPSLGRIFAQSQAYANRCLSIANVTGSLISTAFAARDLISVAEALDDGKLRYWGTSYGTTLGITALAMFPDKAERVLLDAVSNPHEYYDGLGETEMWTNSDKVFSAIFTGCVERPENCTLSRNRPNATAAELEQMVWDLFEEVRERPIVICDLLLDYTTVKSMVVTHIYGPAGWPGLADQLDMILSRDRDDELYETLFDSLAILESLGAADSLPGIKCSERRRRSDLDGFLPVVEELRNKSRFYGEFAVRGQSDCANWKIEAKERYLGGFDIAPAKPVLIVNNNLDGHTPLESAKNVSSTMKDSVLLEVEGIGHGVAAAPSKCSFGHIVAFWSNGTLPAPGTFCPGDAPPYSGRNWATVIQEIAAEAGVKQ